MPEQLSTGLNLSRATCISVGQDAQSLLLTALAGERSAPPARTTHRNFRNTFSARQWLRALRPGQTETGPGATNSPLGPELLVVVDYRPEETWSLTSLLSQLLVLEPETKAHVVLVAEGWRWALPVLVADFPRLSLITADAPASDLLSGGRRMHFSSGTMASSTS